MKLLQVLGCGLLVLAVGLANARAGGEKGGKDKAPTGATNKAAELKKLLKERRDKLDQARRVAVEQYKAGALDFTRVAQVEREALRAAIALADNPRERLAALRDYQKLAEQTLAFVDARYKAGMGSPVDLYQAQALVLEARIGVLREELKAEKRP